MFGRLFGRSQVYDFPAYGSAQRDQVTSPLAQHQRVARIEFLTTMLRTATILMVGVGVAVAIYTIRIMDSAIYVADGSRFGCRVESFLGALL